MTQSDASLNFELKPGARIYFIGIGGISMSGLAEIAVSIGFDVAGSDRHFSDRTAYLINQGMLIHEGHEAANLLNFKPDLVVHTAAIPTENLELQAAREAVIQTIDRAAFLGWLNRRYQQVVNIAGTHGKTTTTAMTALLLTDAGQDPTVHLGAELKQFKTTVRLGEPGRLMVSEACEYKNSFLKFYSTVAAILNIDFDHVDCFKDLNAVIDVFVEFADNLPDQGVLVLPAFDLNVIEMVNRLQKRREIAGLALPRLVWFGLENQTAEWQARNLHYDNGLPQFDVYYLDSFYAHIKLQIPGQHNVVNALAAIACAHLCGGTPDAAKTVLKDFQGAEGRFTRTGTYRGAEVVADYAHHPAAARATLAAAATIPHNHTWVVFQPLTFSRTQILFDEFVDALKDCEWVIFAEIFSDRETKRDYISSRDLVKRINELGGHAQFGESFAVIRAELDQRVKPGDLILVLGPEDIRNLADQLTGRSKHH
ncbi:MAG: UDP-N-acetylmuramate--L-alanine ligase [Eubacteriales bacterium]|nr:UDP-N-acetylmuramate--L-alanine ligase [Eubacteriales bacterium]